MARNVSLVVEGASAATSRAWWVVRRAARSTRAVAFVVLLAATPAAPAQALQEPALAHAPDASRSAYTTPSTTALTEKSGSAMYGYGTATHVPPVGRECIVYGDCATHWRMSLFVGLVSSGPEAAGSGIGGATILVDGKPVTLEEDGTYTSEWNWYTSDWSVEPPPSLEWTAEFLGNDRYTGSSARGVYVPM